MLVSELYSVFASSCVVPLSCIELLTMYGYYCSWVRVNPAQYGKIKSGYTKSLLLIIVKATKKIRNGLQKRQD